MRYRTIKHNDYWYVQVSEGKMYEWRYVTMIFSSSKPFLEDKRDETFNFSSKTKAEKLIKNKIIPYYEPVTEIGDEIVNINVTKEDSDMFVLMKQMIEADENGYTELTKEINSKLLSIHNKEKIELTPFQRILKNFGLYE